MPLSLFNQSVLPQVSILLQTYYILFLLLLLPLHDAGFRCEQSDAFFCFASPKGETRNGPAVRWGWKGRRRQVSESRGTPAATSVQHWLLRSRGDGEGEGEIKGRVVSLWLCFCRALR